MANTLDKKYTNLLENIINTGTLKNDRTGTKTYSLFGNMLSHDMASGFPALTTKKLYFRQVVTELLWFLSGSTNIKWLVDNNCNIWVGDCYKNFLNKTNSRYTQEEFIEKIKTDDVFAKEWGELGKTYGYQWRDSGADTLQSLNDKPSSSWGLTYKYSDSAVHDSTGLDQIAYIINTLRTNPDSRRMLVSSWQPNIVDTLVLPPCHYSFQVWTRELTLEEKVDWLNKKYGDYWRSSEFLSDKLHLENVEFEYSVPQRKISLMFNMRSWDVFLGGPFNIASYGLLLTILGKMTNMVPDQLIVSSADTHLYSNHIEQAKIQISRKEHFDLPTVTFADHVNFDGTIDNFLESCNIDDIKLNNYVHHEAIKAPLSN